MQAGAHHGGEADRAGADHSHRRAGLDLCDIRTPVTRGHNVAQEEGVLVGHVRGDGRARMVRMRHAHELGLATVLAATELPTAFHAVVDPAALAVEALAAEGLAAHGHAVAGMEVAHTLPRLFDNAHELVAEYRIGRGARHGAVDDMQVARADGRARDANNCVGWGLQLRLGAILERDMSVAVVYQGFHGGSPYVCLPAIIGDSGGAWHDVTRHALRSFVLKNAGPHIFKDEMPSAASLRIILRFMQFAELCE